MRGMGNGEWGSGEVGKWGSGEFHSTKNPNTLKPQYPKTPKPQLSVFSLFNSLKCPCSIFQ
ncbi:MAG: hypothetical protein EWV40_07730 [Microcystis flos-aquae Mf_WU_F_19750830_S460]|uniref:Uncharacterized protein n=1 Tax=Microcystis flos-aquae Mf_WU_F_19750830_S460 TaxID=2486237 RepID=A0A552LUG5_9CHRO|nr:MAG: hypothetical protein EWV40_07730 [Microcystis flos-aquae Mf_WU_F_19750830_S460]